jgi:Tfp pilus assembly protein PilV
MLTRTGHSLVEVLVAGLVLLAGVVPAVAALGHSVRWGVKGRARATAVLAASARMDELRANARQTSPACTSLSSGSLTTPGWSEAWTVNPVPGGRLLSVVATVPLPGGFVSDTLTLRLSCS